MIVRLVVLAVATARPSRWDRRSVWPISNVWLGAGGPLRRARGGARVARPPRAGGPLFWGAAGGIAGVALGLGVGSALGAVVPEAGGLGRGLFAPASRLSRLRGDARQGRGARGHVGQALPEDGRPQAGLQGARHLRRSSTDGWRTCARAGSSRGRSSSPSSSCASCSRSPTRRTRFSATAASAASRSCSACSACPRSPCASTTQRLSRQIREVDRKLIELAKTLGGKVVTNDYNLNKIAELTGVAVLNINELADALQAGGRCPAS